MIYVHSLNNNPIVECLNIMAERRLAIDCGNLPDEKIDMHMAMARETFKSAGMEHLELYPYRSVKRVGMVILKPYLYRIDVGDLPSSKARIYMEKTKDQLRGLFNWCESNCSGEWGIGSEGACFSSPEDYTLFKLTFEGTSSLAFGSKYS